MKPQDLVYQMDTIQDSLKSEMVNRGWSKRELSRRSGIDQGAIRRALDKGSARLGTIIVLADTLELNFKLTNK